ncbi:LAMI_0A02630g1_1 [Lachancea mirantina]|uniref:LAMI_0A02630g1_1 n=1 Tax=Lachancea mirantina TaxID=1230905 RepID=A0A1G4IMK9_9SACH|nr:LAMI_0A02630g1_1 [Lachancea mirantina]
MDKSLIKGLSDKLYEKRKATALELEKLVKQCLAEGDFARIDNIIDELCRDYAYALHQPMARIAGLMGLAAAAIALGSTEVAKYLNLILPPVLACFGDQNDQVRFYACESLYNIAKIAKGEVLIYFNEIFDVLCKISADTETSVRGAAELLDRLIKDIVAERASTYVSVVNNDPDELLPATKVDPISGDVHQELEPQDPKLAFSLPKFIPLLTERVYAINPDTRMFLVSWLQVLENIPDLELISYLPFFLGGLFTFLGDSHKDVRVVTHSLLDFLLHEVQRISEVKAIAQKREEEKCKKSQTSEDIPVKKIDGTLISERKKTLLNAFEQLSTADQAAVAKSQDLSKDSKDIDVLPTDASLQMQASVSNDKKDVGSRNGELYFVGQDVHLNFPKIIDILLNTLSSSDSEIQLVVLTWVDTILVIAPDAFLSPLSRLLALLLKILNDTDPRVKKQAQAVNQKLIQLTESYEFDATTEDINYGPIVNTLTLHFLDSDVVAKLACLEWLILIYHKAPKELLEHTDTTFLTLLKSLSDKDGQLISKALDLLSDLCSNSNELYFKKFMEELLMLFKTNSELLKNRSNNILRQLCLKLSPERVYRDLSLILEEEENATFVRMIIQILSTTLITSPELIQLRKKLCLRSDWSLFAVLFRTWCPNPVSVMALCLLSEKYELAYSVLQTFVDFGLSINDLLQIDILVQFLESPVFTRLRLQLLEQERFPYLYKCLYGILMVLPQSKAFKILNTRLNSVSALASQKVKGGAFYKLGSQSSSSTESSESISSNAKQKSENQSLLEHFKNVCNAELNNVKPFDSYDAQLPLLNGVVAPDSARSDQSTPVQDNDDETPDVNEDSADMSSVIYHGDSNTNSKRQVSNKLGLSGI